MKQHEFGARRGKLNVARFFVFPPKFRFSEIRWRAAVQAKTPDLFKAFSRRVCLECCPWTSVARECKLRPGLRVLAAVQMARYAFAAFGGDAFAIGIFLRSCPLR